MSKVITLLVLLASCLAGYAEIIDGPASVPVVYAEYEVFLGSGPSLSQTTADHAEYWEVVNPVDLDRLYPTENDTGMKMVDFRLQLSGDQIHTALLFDPLQVYAAAKEAGGAAGGGGVAAGFVHHLKPSTHPLIWGGTALVGVFLKGEREGRWDVFDWDLIDKGKDSTKQLSSAGAPLDAHGNPMPGVFISGSTGVALTGLSDQATISVLDSENVTLEFQDDLQGDCSQESHDEGLCDE